MDFESILDLAKTKINPLKCTKNEGFYILESDFQIKKEAEIPDFLKSEENTNSVLKDFDERFDNIESRMDRAVAFLDLYEEEVLIFLYFLVHWPQRRQSAIWRIRRS